MAGPTFIRNVYIDALALFCVLALIVELETLQQALCTTSDWWWCKHSIAGGAALLSFLLLCCAVWPFRVYEKL